MHKQGLFLATALAACFGGLAVPVHGGDATPSFVAAAVADPSRPFLDTARDTDRKPAEIVAFSKIKPGDVVVDFVPGGGYYTRILSRVVGPKGKVYAMVPMKGGAPVISRAAEAKAAKDGKAVRPNPVDAVLAIQNIAKYNNVEVLWESLASFDGQFSVPVQVDAVWTTDNYHDLHNPGFATADGPNGAPPAALDMTAVDKQIFASLKPGGYFLVVDHAAAKGAGFEQTRTLHRADADAVKAEILAAGFVLDGESNVLAAAADDHSKSIMDASLRGKTDQFVLRFRKPANASPQTKRPPRGAMDGYFGHSQESGMGDKSHRWVNYYADGNYDEYGISGTLVQQGTWYWDAAGHNCMIHQFPAPERQGIVCHETAINKRAGETWTLNPGDTRKYTMDSIYTQPKPSDVVGGGLGQE